MSRVYRDFVHSLHHWPGRMAKSRCPAMFTKSDVNAVVTGRAAIYSPSALRHPRTCARAQSAVGRARDSDNVEGTLSLRKQGR